MFSAIEGLRLTGAVMVVLFHLKTYPSGYKGVDLFFVISGFVLYYRYLLRNTRNEPRSQYFVHRLSKIYLLYWTALFLSLLLDQRLPSHGFWQTLFLFPGHQPVLWVSWSLTYEQYFYALFAAFLFIRSSSRRDLLLLFLLIVSSAVTATTLITGFFKGSVLSFLLGHNTWQFILGLSAGYLFEKKRLQDLRWIVPILAAGVCLFCFWNIGYTDPLNPVVYGLISFVLVYLSACLNKRYPFSLPVLTLLGLSTYAMYLFHGMIILYLVKFGVTSSLVLLILTILLSVLIYKFYEAPLLRAIRSGFARLKILS